MDIYEKGGQFTGELSGVTGEIFKSEVVACTFQADRSTADKNKDILVLEGNTKVVSKDMKMTLTCDRIRYDAKTEFVQALGKVKIHGPSGTVTGLEEVWATPDMKEFGTPDMFKKDAR
jgi:LPS export ABC transporter protein LptC